TTFLWMVVSVVLCSSLPVSVGLLVSFSLLVSPDSLGLLVSFSLLVSLSGLVSLSLFVSFSLLVSLSGLVSFRLSMSLGGAARLSGLVSRLRWLSGVFIGFAGTSPG